MVRPQNLRGSEFPPGSKFSFFISFAQKGVIEVGDQDRLDEKIVDPKISVSHGSEFPPPMGKILAEFE